MYASTSVLYWKYKYPTETIKWKVGDTVIYQGHEYKIQRIDKHVYPICLGGGLRVGPKDIK